MCEEVTANEESEIFALLNLHRANVEASSSPEAKQAFMDTMRFLLELAKVRHATKAAPPVAEPAPQTFEEWWITEPVAGIWKTNHLGKQIAYAAWNAAKGSVGCHAPDYKAGGDRGTQQKTSDSEARNTAADRENLSSLSAEGSDVENIRQPPDSTDDRRQQMSVLSVSALSPAVDGGESETPLRAVMNHLRDEEADYLIGRCMPLLMILDENEQAIELLRDIRRYCGIALEPPQPLIKDVRGKG